MSRCMVSGLCSLFDRKYDNMSVYDIILIAILAVCVILAIFFTVRNRKKGCSSCSGCCENCSGCEMKSKE